MKMSDVDQKQEAELSEHQQKVRTWKRSYFSSDDCRVAELVLKGVMWKMKTNSDIYNPHMSVFEDFDKCTARYSVMFYWNPDRADPAYNYGNELVLRDALVWAISEALVGSESKHAR